MITCSNCKTPTDKLAIFPNNLCLECYSVTPEANRNITAQELTQMWGGK